MYTLTLNAAETATLLMLNAAVLDVISGDISEDTITELRATQAELVEQNTEELKVDTFKIHYTTVTSNRFDSKAFKSTHADLYSQYTKQTTSRRFIVA